MLGTIGLAGIAVVNAGTEPAAPPAAIAAPQPQPAATEAGPAGGIRARFKIDSLLQQARMAKDQGDWGNAQAGMLDAAQQLQKMGYERDQVSVLREMTLEPVAGKSEQAGNYVLAGQRAMADYYYSKYLKSKPRDAQWLLEALAWANVAADEALLKRFTARVPDKAHENIDERSRQRALGLKNDDALYLAFEDIRMGKTDTVLATLKTWPYPIDQKHSLLGTSLLHIAAWYNKPDVVKALVEQHKANVNVADNEKDTPLDYAYHLKLDELAAYLLSKGGKPNNDYHKRKLAPAKDTANVSAKTAELPKPAATQNRSAAAQDKPAAAPNTP